MGREVRRVPADWQHPKEPKPEWPSGRMVDRYKPLYQGENYQNDVDQWDEACAKWKRGEFPDYADATDRLMTYEQWSGQRPHRDDYMPNWPESERTHFMMYEDTSEGTPISPAFATPEELARWLADTGASAFGNDTATYESWLRVVNGGFACSMVIVNGVAQNGVDALT